MNRIKQLERYRQKNRAKTQDEIYHQLCDSTHKLNLVKPADFIQRKSSKAVLDRFFGKVR